MSNKEASIRLTLKGDGFKRGMSDTEADAKKKATSIGSALKSSLAEAGKAGLESFKATFGRIKDVAMGFIGVAGGLGFAEMAKKALENESAFRKMSFAIKSGSGELVNWKDLQKEAQATALKTGHTTNEIAESMKKLRDVSGDTTFARKASETVATAATGAHESLESMTNVAAGLNEKFGITQDQMGDALATVVQMGNAGGLTVEELSDNINRMGAGAKQAGLSGKEGFQTMVEWLHVAHESTGNFRKGISAVSGIIDGMSSGSLKMPLLQHAQYDLDAAKKSGKDFNTILGDIIKKTGGKQENLAKIFTGDQLKVVAELGKKYSTAFSSTTGDVKAKTDAGLKAYNEALSATGKATMSFKDLQDEAAQEMETPEKKIATSLEKLQQAIASPKMMGAFEKLADFMPKVVDAITSHPLVTGALLSGLPQALASTLTSSLISALIKGGGGGGGMGLPGQAGAIAAGAGLAYIAGRELIDAHFEAKSRQENAGMAENFTAGNEASALRMSNKGASKLTPQAQKALRDQARAHLAQLNDQIADAMFASNGGANLTKEEAAGANARYQARGGFADISKEQLAQLVNARAELQGALGAQTDIGEASRRRIALGQATYQDTEAFQGSLEENPYQLLGAGGAKQKRHRVRFTSGLGAINQDERDASDAKKAADAAASHDQSGQIAAKLADAIGGKQLQVRVINPEEIRGPNAGNVTPGLVPRG